MKLSVDSLNNQTCHPLGTSVHTFTSSQLFRNGVHLREFLSQAVVVKSVVKDTKGGFFPEASALSYLLSVQWRKQTREEERGHRQEMWRASEERNAHKVEGKPAVWAGSS